MCEGLCVYLVILAKAMSSQKKKSRKCPRPSVVFPTGLSVEIQPSNPFL